MSIKMKQKPQTIKALVIAVIIAGILGSITILAIDSLGVEGIKVLGICLSLIIYGICGAVCMVVSEKPAYKTLGGAGMIIAVFAFVLTAVVIIAEIGDAGFLQFLSSLFIILLGLSHICLLHHFNLQNKYASYARITATVAIALFTLLSVVRTFDSFLFYESFFYNQATYKIIFVAFVVDIAATLLVPLCNRLQVPEKAELNFEESPSADLSEKESPAV